MQIRPETTITREFLRDNPNIIFVFGDNEGRVGYGGAAALRDEPNTYGFVTKKDLGEAEPNFMPDEYISVFVEEALRLRQKIAENQDKMFYISRLGAGLANKFKIWEEVILPVLPKILKDLDNVIFLWR